MRTPFYILLCLIFFGCQSEIDKNDCKSTDSIDITNCFSSDYIPGIFEYYDLISGDLKLESNAVVPYTVEEGNKLVFIFRKLHGFQTVNIDDEYEERIIFQIDGAMDSFTLENQEQLEEAKCIYSACGNALPSAFFENIRGNIAGEKLADCEWSIRMNLTIESYLGRLLTYQIDQVFRG